MKFIYKAKSGLDKIVEGEIDAKTKEDALDLLLGEGLFPLEVNVFEASVDAAAKKQPAKTKSAAQRILPFGKFGQKISSQQLLFFTQKLNTLARSKVDLLTALKIVHDQTEHPVFKEVILKIHNATREGQTFSSVLAEFPQVFSPLYVNIIRAGETGGALEASFDQISEFLSREEDLRKKITVAMAYPSILLFMGLVSVFVLINFVVPRLSSMFDSMEQDLPLITRIVLSLSEFSKQTWMIVAGVALLLFLLIYFQKGALVFKRFFRKCRTKIPIVKRITHFQELAFFSRSMGMLLQSGVPVVKALSTTIPGVEDTVFRAELEQALRKVAAGQSFYESIESVRRLPSFFISMVAVGEKSGRLSEMFTELSHSYSQQIESDISLLGTLIEPLLILFLGLILGTIVMSILIPMFQITQMIH